MSARAPPAPTRVPAAYGRGGVEPTGTDAMVNLGWLLPEAFLGGQMEVRPELARAAFEQGPAQALGMSVEEASMGAVQILTHSMVQSIEENSVRKGYDPRDFALVAEGGAGPLFAAQIALEVGTPWVLVPPHPGITSAMGLLATDMVYEYVSTAYQRLSQLDAAALQRQFEELEERARAQLEEDGIPAESMVIQWVADCRYLGQGYELRVDVESGAIDEAWGERVRASFHDIHEREYSRRFEDSDIEIPNVRVRGIGRMPRLSTPEVEKGPESPEAALRYERDAWFRVRGELAQVPTRYYERSALKAGNRLDGPAIVNQYDSTTVIPPEVSAHVDGFGNIVIATGVPAETGRAGAGGGRMSAAEYEVGRQPGPPTRKRVEVDPITLRVLGGAFHATAKEMAGVLFRMSYSSIIRESEDLGAGIFDAQGRELCESDSTPMHIGSLPWYIRGFLHRLEGTIEDGDVIVHNHPYLGASHSPDVAVAVPIFHEGELLGFAAVTAHVLDVGGSFPGINADAFDVYAEAKLYNALRWYRRGELNEDLDQMIFDNVRTETMNRGDMNAMLAACRLGKERFLRLVDRYGVEVVMSAAYDWMDYSERMLRSEIEKIPDGTYGPVIGWLDDDARTRDVQLRVETRVIVEGDEITIDLTGSNPEVPTGFNVPFEGSLLVSCYYAVRTILLDEVTFPEHVPQNDGVFRPVKVIAPKGTIFNPTFPRACFSRFCQTQRVVDNINLALADALPDKVTGGNSAGIHFCAYAGFDEGAGEYWLYLEVNEGAYGGRCGKDAMDSVDNLMANTRNNPIEELDMRFPMRCDQYELRPEPAAPGKWRGGVGIIRRNRFLVDGTYSCEGDRQTDPPQGIFGAWDGLVASCRKNPDTSREEQLPAKVTGYPFAAGEFIEFREPNAAGYGDPLERDPLAVREDVLDDFTTIELARDAYGVVFADERTLEIDEAATEARRAELREQRRSSSLGDYFSGRGLVPSSAPVSVAGNGEFGI